MINCLLIGIGGFIGSILRYLISLLPLNTKSSFPINTLTINFLGCVLIGLIMTYATKKISFNENILLMLKFGLCGGFTTFSTFSLESIILIENGKFVVAISYIFLSIILCLGGVLLGKYIIE